MSNTNISTSLSDSIFSQETKDSLVDLAEASLDNILNNDAIKEIPIIKTAIGLYKGAMGFKERFTLQKIARFLSNMDGISDEEKVKFLSKMDEEEKYEQNVMEKVILLIDRIDDLEKTKMLGVLFKECVKSVISLEDFYQLGYAIENSYIDHLKAFCSELHQTGDKVLRDKIKEQWHLYYINTVTRPLSSVGLLSEMIQSYESTINRLESGAGQVQYYTDYQPSKIGWILLKHFGPYNRRR